MPMKMRGLRAAALLVLLLAGGAHAIQCHLCGTPDSPACERGAYKITCSPGIRSCMVLFANDSKERLLVSGCGLANRDVPDSQCLQVNDTSTGRSGFGCFCSNDHCNTAEAFRGESKRANGIRCYLCGTPDSPACERGAYNKITCSSGIRNCMVLFANDSKDRLLVRDCGLVNREAADNKCLQVNDTSTGRIGFGCFCNGDFCNSAVTVSAAGRMFAVVLSLAALFVSRKLV
ncbi:unnamed protein product [Darwinula stevensoni]|uniref:Protein quiver n=1 Tax=Darwinula stevensoni TaxID=69355 RepID=A0A7R8X1I9_9CRUS|nr:unnamed protein product [Darwinula stevensoni]CAG0882373.1 unnamed protein product [Darwinula stevensoni]